MSTQFTTDWSLSIAHWPQMLSEFIGRPNLRFLEIGCFEGRTTLWLVKNVLTEPSSVIEVIDTFAGNREFNEQGIDGSSWPRFEFNLSEHLQSGKVIIHRGLSYEILRSMDGKFDFIYVDASHFAADVLADAVLAWPLLKYDGLMCFDDYLWGRGAPAWQTPMVAIHAFVTCYQQQLVGKPCGMDQYIVRKTA